MEQLAFNKMGRATGGERAYAREAPAGLHTSQADEGFWPVLWESFPYRLRTENVIGWGRRMDVSMRHGEGKKETILEAACFSFLRI